MHEAVHFISAGKFVSRSEWIHARRTIDSHELLFVLRGAVHMSVGAQQYDLMPGQLLHIRPDVVHAGTQVSTETVSFYWVHFSRQSPGAVLPPEHLQLRDPSRLEILCKQLLHYANTPGYPRDCADCCVRLILMELQFQNQEDAASANALCAAVEEWIRIHCDRPVKVADIARSFSFHPDYLSRVFRRHHPEGLKAYIDTVRCDKIKQALCDRERSLRDIAGEFGFEDYKYFLKYFRFHEGITPTAYRKAYYNTHMNCK